MTYLEYMEYNTLPQTRIDSGMADRRPPYYPCYYSSTRGSGLALGVVLWSGKLVSEYIHTVIHFYTKSMKIKLPFSFLYVQK